jgi:RNA polymerase sigma-70 factor (ECF subfamily)
MAEDGAASVAGVGEYRQGEIDPILPDPIESAVRRFQEGRGNEDAFRLLYETYFQSLRRFFARKGLPPQDCLDLTQETFLGIYRGLDGYEDRQRFAAWLYRIATTTFLKWRRAGATAKRAALEIPLDVTTDAEPTLMASSEQLESLLDEERQQQMLRAIAELPEQMRDCLTLRFCHQLSYREIAVVKRLSIDAVKANLFRARKRLEAELTDFSLGDPEI